MRKKEEKAAQLAKDAPDQVDDSNKKEGDGEQSDSDSSSDNLSSESEDSDKMGAEDAEARNAAFVNKDDKVRTDVRNLR